MTASQVVGLGLIVAGVGDVAVAVLVIAREAADENRRKILLMSLGVSAAGMLGLGAAFLMGALGTP